ncbi:zinc-finger protein [Malassezia sp. CBS 17886]|nr:zinc-finger protein [Malassezia sp. CBS 17886]
MRTLREGPRRTGTHSLGASSASTSSTSPVHSYASELTSPETGDRPPAKCAPCASGASDYAICYDPECALPSCNNEPLQTALTFGLLPCAEDHGQPQLLGSACSSGACPSETRTKCFDAECAVPPTLSWAATPPCDPAPGSACISVCDGFAPPPRAESCSCETTPFGGTPLPHSAFLPPDALSLPHTPGGLAAAVACGCLDGLPLWPADGVLTHAHAPAHAGAEPGSVLALCDAPRMGSGAACAGARPSAPASVPPHSCMPTPRPGSTPPMPRAHTHADGHGALQHAMQHTPTDNIAPLYLCQWADCEAHVASLEALATHVQNTHLAQALEVPALTGPMPGMDSWPHAWAWDSPTAHGAPRGTGDTGVAARLGAPPDAAAEPDCPCLRAADGRKRHACGWVGCDASYDTHAALTDHITYDHVGSGKTEYVCGWVGCERAAQGRTFSQKQKVLRHIQTHTGYRPHQCPVCSKHFSEANTLAQHMRTHTNERPYKCEVPGCGKSFSVAGSLTIHKRTHTGDKPFRCPYAGCNKQFSESSNLNKHLRVHRGEKPFHCAECGKSFARPDQAARHRRTHMRGAVKQEANGGVGEWRGHEAPCV